MQFAFHTMEEAERLFSVLNEVIETQKLNDFPNNEIGS